MTPKRSDEGRLFYPKGQLYVPGWTVCVASMRCAFSFSHAGQQEAEAVTLSEVIGSARVTERRTAAGDNPDSPDSNLVRSGHVKWSVSNDHYPLRLKPRKNCWTIAGYVVKFATMEKQHGRPATPAGSTTRERVSTVP